MLSAPAGKGKVSFFIEHITYSGYEKIVYNISNYMAEKGCDVCFIIGKRKDKEEVDWSLINKKIKLVNLNVENNLQLIFEVSKYLRTEAPEVLFSGPTINKTFFIAIAKFIAFSKTKLIWTEHSDIGRELIKRSFITRLAYRICFIISGIIADKIITVSQSVKNTIDNNTLFDFIKKKTLVIHNPVLSSAMSTTVVTNKWFNADYKIILACGRLEYPKNYPLMLKAFAELTKAIPKSRLIIIGTGKEENKLLKQTEELKIQDKVDFVGFQKNPLSFMAKADVLCLSSDFEGLPTVIIESLFSGCPVVSTACGSGPIEILENGKYGMLVPVEDAAALAKGLEDVLLGKVKYDKEGLKKRAEDFSVEKIMPQYMEAVFGKGR